MSSATIPETTGSGGGEPFSPQLRCSVVVVMVGSWLVFTDATVVNVAVESIASDLATSLTSVQWAVTGYLLALAAVLPATGWAARRFGPSRVYIAGLSVFTVSSAVAALAPTVGVLVAARVSQGIGGGMIMPVGTIIWTAQSTRAQIGRVMGLISIPVVTAPMLGPLLAGALIHAASWRSIFWVNVPVGVALVVAAIGMLPADAARRREEPLDWIGLALLVSGMVGLTYAVNTLTQASTVSALTVAAAMLAVAALLGFVVWARRTSRPLLDVRLYANRSFAAAALAMTTVGAVIFGGMILLPLYFQIVRGESVLVTGALLAPSGAGALVAVVAGPSLIERYGGKTAVAGVVVAAAATVPFTLITAETSLAWLMLAMLIRGAGVGLALMPIMTAAYRALPAASIPDATPQLNMLQRLGGSLGTAVFTVIVTNQLHQAVSLSGQAQAFQTAFAWVLAATIATIIPALLLAVLDSRGRGEEEPRHGRSRPSKIIRQAKSQTVHPSRRRGKL